MAKKEKFHFVLAGWLVHRVSSKILFYKLFVLFNIFCFVMLVSFVFRSEIVAN